MAIIRPDDPVRLLVSEPLAWIEPGATLLDLASKLELEQIGAVTVMTGDRFDGVVSERDIVRALAAGCDPSEVWAADVMAEAAVSVDVDDPIVLAAERMLEEGVRHLPVIGADGHALGVVSVREVLRVFTESWRRAAQATSDG